MITVFEVGSTMCVGATKKTVFCPFCKYKMSFYNMSPEKCKRCNKNLLSYYGLINGKMYRMNYHFGFINTVNTSTVYI